MWLTSEVPYDYPVLVINVFDRNEHVYARVVLCECNKGTWEEEEVQEAPGNGGATTEVSKLFYILFATCRINPFIYKQQLFLLRVY